MNHINDLTFSKKVSETPQVVDGTTERLSAGPDLQSQSALFDAFRTWANKRPPRRVGGQIFRCLKHLECLELNAPDPGAVLIANAAADFAALERMVRP